MELPKAVSSSFCALWAVWVLIWRTDWIERINRPADCFCMVIGSMKRWPLAISWLNSTMHEVVSCKTSNLEILVKNRWTNLKVIWRSYGLQTARSFSNFCLCDDANKNLYIDRFKRMTLRYGFNFLGPLKFDSQCYILQHITVRNMN